MTHYSLNRAPETVAKLGHPELRAWTLRAARDGYVRDDAGHREAVRASEAARHCIRLYGVSLKEALARGMI